MIKELSVITVRDNGNLDVRELITEEIKGKIVKKFHRYVLTPLDSTDGQYDEIKTLAAKEWTQEKKDACQARIDARNADLV